MRVADTSRRPSCFTFALRRTHHKMTARKHSRHMRKLVVLIVVLGVLITVGAAGAASGIPQFPTVPGNWSHVDINRKIGRNWHTLTLDRGRIIQVSTTQ